MGLLRRLRGEAAPRLLDQPRAPLLRAHGSERRGRAPRAGAAGGSGSGGGDCSPEALGRPRAYRSGALGEELAGRGVLLATEKADRRASIRQQVEVCFAALKHVFGLDETTLAKTLVGLAIRVAAKVTAYTYGLYVNRLFGRPQGRIKELWA